MCIRDSTYTAGINYAHRYGKLAEEMAAKENNPQRRAELMQISKNCYKVPEHPAETFWEAQMCIRDRIMCAARSSPPAA